MQQPPRRLLRAVPTARLLPDPSHRGFREFPEPPAEPQQPFAFRFPTQFVGSLPQSEVRSAQQLPELRRGQARLTQNGSQRAAASVRCSGTMTTRPSGCRSSRPSATGPLAWSRAVRAAGPVVDGLIARPDPQSGRALERGVESKVVGT